jgi:phthalate 4,5-dioxygenase
MGTIVDRSQEHLGTSDRAVIMIRQLLLDAVAKVEAGEDPLGLDTPSQRLPRGYDEYVPAGADWREYLRDALVPKW